VTAHVAFAGKAIGRTANGAVPDLGAAPSCIPPSERYEGPAAPLMGAPKMRE